MANSDRGFASMNKAAVRKIASMGGKAAHAKRTAHEWTHEEAVVAGRKGGLQSQSRKNKSSAAAPISPDPKLSTTPLF